jgi:hypothetical protein
MNIEKNLTKNAFRTYFIAVRKGFSSSRIDFSSLSSIYACWRNRLKGSTAKGE